MDALGNLGDLISGTASQYDLRHLERLAVDLTFWGAGKINMSNFQCTQSVLTAGTDRYIKRIFTLKKKFPFRVICCYFAPFQNDLIVIVGGNRKSVGDATKHTMTNKLSKVEY